MKQIVMLETISDNNLVSESINENLNKESKTSKSKVTFNIATREYLITFFWPWFAHRNIETMVDVNEYTKIR